MLFLQESKLKKVGDGLLRKLGINDSICSKSSSADGSSGGLISMWTKAFFDLEDKIISSRYIVLIGSIRNLNLRCGLVNIYSPNDNKKQFFFWEELRFVLSDLEMSLCCGGDFNVIRFSEEKIGAGDNFSAMGHFNDFIEDLELVDLPLEGGKFTWFSNQDAPTFCRLDRFLVSSTLLDKWGHVAQKLLPRFLSDHNPLLLCGDSTN
ncbi:hypothetical protein REPUB_Repub15cG0083100 [Reevesia pubescens]